MPIVKYNGSDPELKKCLVSISAGQSFDQYVYASAAQEIMDKVLAMRVVPVSENLFETMVVDGRMCLHYWRVVQNVQ